MWSSYSATPKRSATGVLVKNSRGVSEERLAFFKAMSEEELHEWSRRRLDMILSGECVAGAAPQAGLSKPLFRMRGPGTLASAGKRTHTERTSQVATRPSKMSEGQVSFLRYLNHRGTLTFEKPGRATRLMADEVGSDVGYISAWLNAFEEVGWVEVDRTPEGGRPMKVCITDEGAKVARNRYLGLTVEEAVLVYLKDNGPVFGTPGTGTGGGRGGAAAALGYAGKEVDLDAELLYGVTSISHAFQSLDEEGAIVTEKEHNRFIVGAWMPGTPKRRVRQAKEATDARAGKGNVQTYEHEVKKVERVSGPPPVASTPPPQGEEASGRTAKEIAEALLEEVVKRATADQAESSAASVFKARCAELAKELEQAKRTASNQGKTIEELREEVLRVRTQLNETIVERNELEERLAGALSRLSTTNGNGSKELRQSLPPETQERLAKFVTDLPR